MSNNEETEVTALSILQKMDTQKGNLVQLINTYIAISAAAEVGRRWYRQYRSKTTYTVRIDDEDQIWTAAHKWLLSQPDADKTRSFFVETYYRHPVRTPSRANKKRQSERPTTPQPVMAVYADDSVQHHITLEDTHKVLVGISKQQDERREGNAFHMSTTEQMIFTCEDIEGRDAVLRLIASLADKKASQEKIPYLYTASSFGEWALRSDLSLRTMDTVILPDEQKRRIVDDVSDFLASADRYDELGIPYHRGYLFHGPPGTGKTSIAKALADMFKMDIYYLSLSDMRSDTNLLTTIMNVPHSSILLLEDIDVLHAAKERDDDNDGISLSGLLNALDGIATPDGLITIMTTNHIEVLDEAIVRPGRCDLVEEITYMDDNQLGLLGELMFTKKIALPPISRDITPAQVIEHYKRNIHDEDIAYESVVAFLKEG